MDKGHEESCLRAASRAEEERRKRRLEARALVTSANTQKRSAPTDRKQPGLNSGADCRRETGVRPRRRPRPLRREREKQTEFRFSSKLKLNVDSYLARPALKLRPRGIWQTDVILGQKSRRSSAKNSRKFNFSSSSATEFTTKCHIASRIPHLLRQYG